MEYRAKKRYGYIGIDLYSDKGACLRTVLTGIKPHKLGYEIADLLNGAYANGYAAGYIAGKAYAFDLASTLTKEVKNG